MHNAFLVDYWFLIILISISSFWSLSSKTVCWSWNKHLGRLPTDFSGCEISLIWRPGFWILKQNGGENRVESTVNLASPQKGGGLLEVGGLNEGFTAWSGCRMPKRKYWSKNFGQDDGIEKPYWYPHLRVLVHYNIYVLSLGAWLVWPRGWGRVLFKLAFS